MCIFSWLTDSDGQVVFRYFERGCLQGFVHKMVDEISENNLDVTPIPYSICTTEDVNKRMEMIAMKEQEKSDKWKTGENCDLGLDVIGPSTSGLILYGII